MIINTLGKIIDDLYMIGHPAVPVYLFDGTEPVIFDAGYSCFGRTYVRQIRKILGNRPPAYCFLSHSHFDHCGSVSIFKAAFPSIKIVSSAKAKAIFIRPNAVALMKKLSISAEHLARDCGITGIMPDGFNSFDVDITVKNNEIIALSNHLTVRIIETPGHTNDCISFYVPEKKILLCSESFGIQDQTGYIFSDFLIDYDLYLDSMERMRGLETEVIGIGHNYAYTGKDAETFKKTAILSCKAFLKMAEAFLVEDQGHIDTVVNRIKKIEYDGQTGFVQPEPAYLLNLEARITVVKKRMEEHLQRATQ